MERLLQRGLLGLLFCLVTVLARSHLQAEEAAEVTGGMGPAESPLHAVHRPLPPSAYRGPYLGVVVHRLPPGIHSHVGTEPGVGLLVVHVFQDSPAEAVGLQPNDILLKFDDQLVVNLPQLDVLVRMRPLGAKVPLTIIREGRQMVLLVTLSRPDVPSPGDGPSPALDSGGQDQPSVLAKHYADERTEQAAPSQVIVDTTAAVLVATQTEDGWRYLKINKTAPSRVFQLAVSGPTGAPDHVLTVRNANDSLVFQGRLPNLDPLSMVPDVIRQDVQELYSTLQVDRYEQPDLPAK